MRYVIGFIILSWVIYIPSFYLFFDNAEETVEDVTLEYLWPMYSMSPNDTEMIENQLKTLEKNDVQVDSTLKSVLEDWDVNNLNISSQNSDLPGLKLVTYSFEMDKFKVLYHAKAIEKSLLRVGEPGPSAHFIMIDAIECINGENSRVLSHEDDLKMFLISTFAKPKTKGLYDALRQYCPSTGVKVVEAEEVAEVINPESHVTPSFDCSAASTNIEQMICNDNELAALDNKLNEVYNDYNQYLGDGDLATDLSESQAIWLENRNACEDTECVALEYSIRIDQLQKLLEDYMNSET